MLEFLLEVFGEFLLQVLCEVLPEIVLRSLAEPLRRPPNPWFAAVGYAILGAIAGGLSLLLFPTHFVLARSWRIVNFIVTPLAVGLCMAALGAWRARQGQTLLRIDRFSYGFLFALALALVWFWFAK